MILKVKLKEILKEKGMTQKKLAEITGLTPNTISDLAKNSRDSINRYHIGLVAEALEMDIIDLLYSE